MGRALWGLFHLSGPDVLSTLQFHKLPTTSHLGGHSLGVIRVAVEGVLGNNLRGRRGEERHGSVTSCVMQPLLLLGRPQMVSWGQCLLCVQSPQTTRPPHGPSSAPWLWLRPSPHRPRRGCAPRTHRCVCTLACSPTLFPTLSATHPHLGQQIREGADGGGLAGAAVAHDHDAPDLGVDHIQDERQLHLLLAHDGREGEDGAGGT